MSGRVQRRVVAFMVVCLVLAALLLAGPGKARPRVPGPVFSAVRAEWKTRAERVEAFDVIACETGGRYNPTARNGQYLGLFQMGARERARFGHGPSARAQAHSAHAYFLVSGWGPWRACR